MPAQPPLVVTCLTCGRRLRVVDPRLIGSIANCPQCGAMVEITAAAQAPSPGQEPSPAQAPASAEQPEPPAQPLVPSPPLPESASDPQASAPADRSQAPPVVLDPPQPEEADSNQAATGPATAGGIRQFGLVIALAACGLVAAAAVFWQFVRSWSDGPAAAVASAAAVDEPSDSEEEPPAQAAAELADSGETGGDIGGNAAAEAPGEGAPLPDGSAAPAARDPAAAEVPAAEPVNKPGSAAVAGPAGDAPAAIDGAVGDPGGSDPLGPDDVPAKAEQAAAGVPDRVAEPASPETTSLPGLDELPPGLRQFVPLLNHSIADNGPPRIFDMPPTIDSIQLDAAAGDVVDEEAEVKRPPIDVARALTMRLAVDHDGATLSELMLLVSQMTGVAVELELISLDLAGIETTQTLKSASGWMSVQQWLERSLAPAGLAVELLDQHVLVHATAEKILATSGEALRLDDFGQAAAEVARWIRPVVGPLPPVREQQQELASKQQGNTQDIAEAAGEGAAEAVTEDGWEFLEDEQRLVVPLERTALVRAILAVEAARQARGLPARLPRWQTERWAGVWDADPDPEVGRRDAAEQAARTQATGEQATGGRQAGQGRTGQRYAADDLIGDWPLVVAGRGGPMLDAPRTNAGLLRQLGSDNQVAIVVAWRDALRHQFYPADLAMPFSDSPAAGPWIEELVGEAALQPRVAGKAVWWLGSEALYDRYEVIVWLEIPEGSGEAIAQRLADALGVADPSDLPLAWDATTLLVRTPRYLARQLTRLIQVPGT